MGRDDPAAEGREEAGGGSMNLLPSIFRGSTSSSSNNSGELPEIYSLSLKCQDFIREDILATYTRILTDAAERTHGLKDEQWRLLWDSCVQSQGGEGLITMLAHAMLNKADLFLVYKPSVNILRRADETERQQIERDYREKGESPVGTFISFRNYRKTDMLRVFSEMEYYILASLHKTVNLAKAVQLKFAELRATVGLSDSNKALDQARQIASALRNGKDIAIDAKDVITTSTPDIEPTREAIAFLDAKRAFHLSLPLAYISGLQTGGIGASGDADARAIDRGLRPYSLSILQPVYEEVFGVKTVEYRPEDQREIEAGLEVIKGLELVSDDLLSRETKRLLVARSFDVDPEAEADRIEAEKARAEEPEPEAPEGDSEEEGAE